jgi:tight adherence protein C
MLAAPATILGFLVPDLLLGRAMANQRRAIQQALPDALDLLVVCIEAGSSLDQAILKASEELEIAYPAMAKELRTVATEIRAGKPRLEAFQNLAKRTKLDDVRALVAMLIQTDRFGTSIAQALRAHADTLRTKRRHRAEERAGKVGVKLVFPLLLCLLPALYVVCLGPVAIRIYRTLF